MLQTDFPRLQLMTQIQTDFPRLQLMTQIQTCVHGSLESMSACTIQNKCIHVLTMQLVL